MKKPFFLFRFTLLLLASLCFNLAFAMDELIMRNDSEFHPTHNNRFSLILGFNPSVQKATDISNFTFSLGKKIDDYWLDTNLILTSGFFNKLSTNNTSATGVSDSLLNDSKSSHTTLGIGIGRETNYTHTLLSINNLYEVMAANVTYNIFKDSTSTKTFTGPGMIAKFSVYKKFSDYLSAGTQFTYNLATVKRPSEKNNESSSAKSLTLSYLTIGFDLSLYL